MTHLCAAILPNASKKNGLLERDQSVIHKVGKRVHHIAKHGGYAVARDYNAPYGELKLAKVLSVSIHTSTN